MKTKISLPIALAIVTAVSAAAQVVPTTTLTPGAPNISPVTPGFNNDFGPIFNRFGTNAVPSNLDTGLAALQNDIQQMLPVLQNFNDNVAFSALSAALQTASTGGSTTPVPLSGQNLSTRTSSDLSTLSSQNLAAPVAAGPVNGGSFSTAISGAPPTALSPTGVNNPLGLAPGFGGPVATNAFGTPITARDVVRDLIVLQNDLERLLPVLVTLNGSSLPSGFTNMVGSLNTPSASGFSTALTPTGR
jgi:hypothetical protein